MAAATLVAGWFYGQPLAGYSDRRYNPPAVCQEEDILVVPLLGRFVRVGGLSRKGSRSCVTEDELRGIVAERKVFGEVVLATIAEGGRWANEPFLCAVGSWLKHANLSIPRGLPKAEPRATNAAVSVDWRRPKHHAHARTVIAIDSYASEIAKSLLRRRLSTQLLASCR